MFYTVSDSQHEILHSISRMYLQDKRVHLDLCYNVGGFYSPAGSRIAVPEFRNDLNLGSGESRSGHGITNFDCRCTNLPAGSIRSIVFDPPFLIGSNNRMTDRYGGFDSAPEMFSFQEDSLREISRILKNGGILITKIQDFCHGRQKYFPSIYQVNKAIENDLHLVDSFILINKRRFRAKTSGRLTAVSAHCFFHVFRKGSRKKRISRY